MSKETLKYFFFLLVSFLLLIVWHDYSLTVCYLIDKAENSVITIMFYNFIVCSVISLCFYMFESIILFSCKSSLSRHYASNFIKSRILMTLMSWLQVLVYFVLVSLQLTIKQTYKTKYDIIHLNKTFLCESEAASNAVNIQV